ncbi:DUF4177 domain-containing protein [Sulfuriroseicoccus oceanibius]|uniref:DUF4177 domain-containing protein n=1 Tax=Sulfuriroseicoccus oceanibius TaxID=2707525 RepID=A0A6B3LED4_9BACT|nr:DUF4177 domain-containing protein [Sulfuriroseicoccus oceanibius]QQL44808.1 DUF4177 domain-containing protein [Sulfuriroseicoccus oceanibius]
MKTTAILLTSSLLAAAPLVAADSEPATTQSAESATSWEYKLVRIAYRGGNEREIAALNKELNESGAEGWELVNTVKSETNDQLLLIFKRSK